MSSNYTETELQLILNKITSAQASTMTMNEGEMYLAPDTAVYSVNNITPTNGNVSIPEGANKDLSNLSSTGNSKFQAPITGGASTITSSNLTANRALVSNSSGKVAVSSVTLSELGYVSGVTSNIQTQLNSKADDSDVIKKDGGSAQQTITLSSGTGTTALGVKSRSTTSYISFSSSSKWLGSFGVNASQQPTFYNGTGYTLATTNDIPDIQINGTSITTNNVANIVTNTAYNASSNKIATMSDVPTDYVTTNTAQNITADKTFTSQVGISSTGYINCGSANGVHTLTDFDLRGRGNTNYHTPRSIVSTGTSLSITKYGNTERTDFIIDGNTIYDGTTGLIPDARISNNIVKKVNNISPDANGNVTVSASATWGGITGTLSDQTDLNSALNSKVSKSVCAEVYPVIQTYRNGASWYRIYSDGWCEQGGKVTPSGSSATTSTIVYLKPFLNTNYFIVANYGSSSSNQYGQCYDLTTTQCTTKSYGGATNSWYACGQLAAGQY